MYHILPFVYELIESCHGQFHVFPKTLRLETFVERFINTFDFLEVMVILFIFLSMKKGLMRKKKYNVLMCLYVLYSPCINCS